VILRLGVHCTELLIVFVISECAAVALFLLRYSTFGVASLNVLPNALTLGLCLLHRRRSRVNCLSAYDVAGKVTE
jgi:hypothetical protein